MGAPLTPEEMAAFQARFGLGQSQGAAPFGPPPPPPYATTPAAPMPVPTLAPGNVIDTGGFVPGTTGRLDERLTPPTAAPLPTGVGLILPTGVGRPEDIMPPGARVVPAPSAAPSAAPAPVATTPGTPPQSPALPMQLSYPPVQVVPGGWQSRERVVNPGEKIADDVKEEQLGALDTQLEGQQIRQASQMQTAQKEREQLNALADAHNDFRAEQAAKQAKRDFAAEQARVRYETAVDQAAQIGDVNPNRFFAERGAGAQLLAIIGVALGQAGASINGGPNTAMQLIEGAIDRDMQAQRDNIAKAQGNVAASKGVLAEMRGQFGDEQQAEAAAKDAMLANTEIRLKSLAAGAKSDEAKANAFELLSQLQMKRGMLKQQWGSIENDKIEKESQRYTPTHTVGGAPAASPASKESDERLVTLDDGKTYQMRSAEDAKKIRAQLAGVRQIEGLAKDLDKQRDETGTYVPGTKGAANAQSLGAQMLYAFKDTEQAGTVDKGLIESFDKLIGDPNGITSRSGQRALSYAERKRASIISALKANGSRVVQEGYARDQSGNVVPTQAFAGQSVANAAMPAGFKAVDGSQQKAPVQPPIKTFDPDAVKVQVAARKKGKS